MAANQKATASGPEGVGGDIPFAGDRFPAAGKLADTADRITAGRFGKLRSGFADALKHPAAILFHDDCGESAGGSVAGGEGELRDAIDHCHITTEGPDLLNVEVDLGRRIFFKERLKDLFHLPASLRLFAGIEAAVVGRLTPAGGDRSGVAAAKRAEILQEHPTDLGGHQVVLKIVGRRGSHGTHGLCSSRFQWG